MLRLVGSVCGQCDGALVSSILRVHSASRTTTEVRGPPRKEEIRPTGSTQWGEAQNANEPVQTNGGEHDK